MWCRKLALYKKKSKQHLQNIKLKHIKIIFKNKLFCKLLIKMKKLWFMLITLNAWFIFQAISKEDTRHQLIMVLLQVSIFLFHVIHLQLKIANYLCAFWLLLKLWQSTDYEIELIWVEKVAICLQFSHCCSCFFIWSSSCFHGKIRAVIHCKGKKHQIHF